MLRPPITYVLLYDRLLFEKITRSPGGETVICPAGGGGGGAEYVNLVATPGQLNFNEDG